MPYNKRWGKTVTESAPGHGGGATPIDLDPICREIFESSIFPVLLTQAGKVIAANRSALRMHGYASVDEVRGRQILEFVHPDDRELVRKQMIERHPGTVQRYSIRTLRKGGDALDVSVSSWEVRIGDRETVVIALADQTEMRRAQTELGRAHALLSAMMRAIPDMVYYKDLEGRFLAVNRAFEHMLGKHSSEVIGKKIEDLLSPDHARRFTETDRVVIDSGAPVSYSYTLADPQGRRHSFDVVKVPVFDDKGEMVGLVGVHRDVSERERLHEELALAERMIAVGTLARGIAHEYNNILTALRGLLEYAARPDAKESEIRSDVSEAVKLVERAAELTQQIVALAEGPPPHKRPCRLDQVARSALSLVKESFMRDGVTIVDRYAPETPTIVADRAQVAQLLLSLLTVAKEAVTGRAEKKITVTTGRRGESAVLSVEDTGRGRAPDPFDGPFGAAQSQGARIGLGLAVAERIARNHGGALEVRSVPDVGTTVTVLLPVQVAETQPASRADAGVLQGRKILVVEDEPATRRLSARALSAAGADPREAADAREALAALKKERFDAILLDLVLPGPPGEEVLDAARRLPAARRPVVVVFTGLVAPQGYQHLLDRGAAKILYKPHTSPQDVVSELAELLGKDRKDRD